MIPESEKLAKCLNLLKEIFGEVSLIMAWLEYPHPFLGKPREAMVSGKIDQVILELERIKNSDPS